MSRNPCRFLRSEIDRVLQSAKKAGASLTAQSVADTRENLRRALQSSGRRRAPIFAELDGKSANEIARILNARNVATPIGKPWSAMPVIRVRKRLALAN
jgi:hypothetical protein